MLTNLKVAFVSFIMKVLYYKGLIIKKAYTFKYCTVYRWRITDNPLSYCILAKIK